MNKIWLIIQREFLNRVQKKSFLIATILLPLIFPAIMAVLVWVAIEQKKNATKETVYYIDESGYFAPDTAKFHFKQFNGSLDDAKRAITAVESFGLLYIPQFDLSNPKGIALYTNVDPSPSAVGDLEQLLANQLRDQKLKKFHVRQQLLDSLKTDVNIQRLSLAGGQEKESDSRLLSGVGMASGILMYMFIFIYGAQIMQGVIEEKTSKVVEVIVSSVKPLQLMLGKIIGLASVGLLQFIIWIVLITTVSTVVLGAFGLQMQSPELAAQYGDQGGNAKSSRCAGAQDV
ncbi:ABC transporter permease [Chryseolinea sp. T2]|uniref:ABC transporter permease n=1 Tax=Chryseolinea sp. T2 TaxID=3129255 RepID=UPI0030781A0A